MSNLALAQLSEVCTIATIFWTTHGEASDQI